MSGWATVAAPRLNGEIPSASADAAEKATLGKLLLQPKQQFRHGVCWCRCALRKNFRTAKIDRCVNVEKKFILLWKQKFFIFKKNGKIKFFKVTKYFIEKHGKR